MELINYESFRKIVYRFAKQYVQLKAKINRNAFYCNALAGESSYNIVINSDLTVSCNCTDYYGDGQLGNLNKESMADIFKGKVASSFRKDLAQGKLPLSKCSFCSELRKVNKKDSNNYVDNYRLPYRGIMVENTIYCNIDCLSCPRESLLKTRPSKQMSLEDVEKVAHILRKLKIESVAYFNLGEPFFNKTIHDELAIIKKIHPAVKIVLSTNGELVDNDNKREAAMMLDEICISLDGSSQKTANKYQRNINFEKAYKNLKDLVSYRDERNLSGPQIEWKYVVFNWNDKQKNINKAIDLAKEAKVDLLSFWPTLTPPYGISWRYKIGRFKKIGKASWKGREVWFK